MPPRASRATQQNKTRQQAPDRDSPAGSLDVPPSTSSAKPAAGGAASNSRKRPAPGSEAASGHAKRKRVESTPAVSDMGPPQPGNSKNKSANGAPQSVSNESEDKELFDLATLSAESLRRYLVKFNLVPPMYPGPSTSYTPPLPSHLVNPPPPPPERSDSPGSATASSRPRRDPKTRTNSNGRRSSRLLEDELQQSVYAGVKETHGNPILPDLRDADKALVEIARKHWETIVLRENDVLEEFSSSIRNKGKLAKAL